MTPSVLPLALFGATYLLLAIGRIPGLALDRTGFAVLGALAFLATLYPSWRASRVQPAEALRYE